jgi:hypothetical protein
MKKSGFSEQQSQALSLRFVGREIKIGKEHLVLVQQRDLLRLRLLDLDDHVGLSADTTAGIEPDKSQTVEPKKLILPQPARAFSADAGAGSAQKMRQH